MMLSRESRNEEAYSEDSNKWVKKLQQESWELELLVSGFSIVLLAKLTEWLGSSLTEVQFVLNTSDNLTSGLVFFMLFLQLASYALIINLVIHLIFRGFWVGTVGLGSVAPNTNFEKLKYSKFFTQKLKKKVSKLDDLVITVDKISSLIFTFAFLIIFFLISVGLFLISIILIQEIGDAITRLFSGPIENILNTVHIFIIIVYLLAGIIYMIDFLTLGFFKKYKWLSKIYYPIYYLFGWVTLSFLYKTLYYNLISKFSKRKIGFILIPYLFTLIMYPFFYFSHHIYFPEQSEKSHLITNYYSNTRSKDDFIRKVDIPSYIIKDDFLPIFLSYSPNDNYLLRKLHPDYIPETNEGINPNVEIRINDSGISIYNANKISEQKKPLDYLSGLYQVYLNDSLIDHPKFYFNVNPHKEEKGIITILDITDLPRGENFLEIKKRSKSDSSKTFENFAFVPFWKK